MLLAVLLSATVASGAEAMVRPVRGRPPAGSMSWPRRLFLTGGLGVLLLAVKDAVEGQRPGSPGNRTAGRDPIRAVQPPRTAPGFVPTGFDPDAVGDYYPQMVLEPATGRYVVGRPAGEQVRLTLDYRYHHAAERVATEFEAAMVAIVAYRVSDGAVLAMVGDSANYPKGKRGLLGDLELTRGAWFNMASFAKAVLALAVLEGGGSASSTFGYAGHPHGDVQPGDLRGPNAQGFTASLSEAFASSNNAVFHRIAAGFDPSVLNAFVREQLGFGQPLSLGIQAPALVYSNEPEVRARQGSGWQPFAAVPWHIAMLAGLAVNGGQLVYPRPVEQVVRGDRSWTPGPARVNAAVRPESAAALKQMMKAAVSGGTASQLSSYGWLRPGGKTGTAHMHSQLPEAPGWLNYTTFGGFIEKGPGGHGTVALAVMVGDGGGAAAVPATARFFHHVVKLHQQ
jgi:cell division protein FtsI/penicillin-binding protein 2